MPSMESFAARQPRQRMLLLGPSALISMVVIRQQCKGDKVRYLRCSWFNDLRISIDNFLMTFISNCYNIRFNLTAYISARSTAYQQTREGRQPTPRFIDIPHSQRIIKQKKKEEWIVRSRSDFGSRFCRNTTPKLLLRRNLSSRFNRASPAEMT